MEQRELVEAVLAAAEKDFGALEHAARELAQLAEQHGVEVALSSDTFDELTSTQTSTTELNVSGFVRA